MSTNEEPTTYHADHELAMLLKAAARSGERLRVQAEDVTVELVVSAPSDASGGIWIGYDPKAAREAWHAATGILANVDADALIEELKRDREQRSGTWPLS